MAATDVLAATPAASPPWTNFDDFLDFQTGSPLATPRLAPASTPVAGPSSATASLEEVAPVASTLSSIPSQAPPPPGSSPEALFRHYLAIELRKIGSNADDAIIDKYVAQHYGSFTRAMERQQAQQQAGLDALAGVRHPSHDVDMPTASTANAFKSPPPAMSLSSAPYLLQGTTTVAPVSLQTPFPSTMHLSSNEDMANGDDEDIKPMHAASSMQFAAPQQAFSSDTTTQSHRSADAMSEDENDEDEDESKDDLTGLPAKAARKSVATEEVPIAGSIMGPANELRPDPETYRTLTSKEKRQLRNKISARNFRTRRKEHISHLEQQVEDRDTLIEGLRQQLAQVTLQNKELNEEVRQLKTKAISSADMQRLIEALQKTAVVGSGASAQSNDATACFSGQQPLLARTASNSSLNEGTSSRPMSPRPASGSNVTLPNTRKDVPASGSYSFWGGVGGSAWPVNSSQAVA